MYLFKSHEFDKWINTSEETRIFDHLSNIKIRDNPIISNIMSWYNNKTGANQGVMDNTGLLNSINKKRIQNYNMMGGTGWCWGMGCNKNTTKPSQLPPPMPKPMPKPMPMSMSATMSIRSPLPNSNSLFDILNYYSREIFANPDILLFLCIFFSPLHQQPLLLDNIGMLDSINLDIAKFINGYIDILSPHLSNTDGVSIISSCYIFCNAPFLKILLDNGIHILAHKSVYLYLPGIILSLYINDPYLTGKMVDIINYIGAIGGRGNPYEIYEIYAINCIIKINNQTHPSYDILYNMIRQIDIHTNIIRQNVNKYSIIIYLASMRVNSNITIPVDILFCDVGHHWDANKDIQELLINKYGEYMEISYRVFINNHITKYYPNGTNGDKFVIINRFRNILDGIRSDNGQVKTRKLYKSITDRIMVFIRTTINGTTIADPDYNNNLTIILIFINMIYQFDQSEIENTLYLANGVMNVNRLVLYQLKYATYMLSDYGHNLYISDVVKYYDAIYDIIQDIYVHSNIYNNDNYRLNQLELILNGIDGQHISILGNRLEMLVANMDIANTPEFINTVKDMIRFKFGIQNKSISNPYYSNSYSNSNSSLLSSVIYSNDSYNNIPISPLVLSNPSTGSYHTNSSGLYSS